MLRSGALVRACALYREMRRLQIFGACCVTRDVGLQAAAAFGRRGGEALKGGVIRSAVHLRYLGHVADKQVECDVAANMRD